MDPPARKEKSKVKEPVSRVEKAKQKSAQQELKQRQRAEVRWRRGLCTCHLLETGHAEGEIVQLRGGPSLPAGKTGVQRV